MLRIRNSDSCVASKLNDGLPLFQPLQLGGNFLAVWQLVHASLFEGMKEANAVPHCFCAEFLQRPLLTLEARTEG